MIRQANTNWSFNSCSGSASRYHDVPGRYPIRAVQEYAERLSLVGRELFDDRRLRRGLACVEGAGTLERVQAGLAPRLERGSRVRSLSATCLWSCVEPTRPGSAGRLIRGFGAGRTTDMERSSGGKGWGQR